VFFSEHSVHLSVRVCVFVIQFEWTERWVSAAGQCISSNTDHRERATSLSFTVCSS